LLTKGVFELNDVSDWCRNYDIEKACKNLRIKHIDTHINLSIEDIPISLVDVVIESDVPAEIVTSFAKVKPVFIPNNSSYKIDHLYDKIDRLYDFAVGEVFNERFTNSNFRVYVENADFFQLYSDSQTKISKLKRLICKINFYVGNKYWYRDASNSIGATPSGCTGTNVNDWKWMEDLNNL